MNQLLMLKTQRVIYLSLLENGDILEAIKFFEKYQKQLRTYADADEETQRTVLKELNSSRNVFLKKLNSIAYDYMKQQKYNKAAVCLSEVIFYWHKDVSCLMQYIICLYNIEQYDVEEEYFEYLKTLIAENSDFKVLKNLAKMCIKIDKLEQAICYMKEYINKIGEDKVESYDYETIGIASFDLYSKHANDLKDGNSIQYLLDSMDYLLKADELDPTSKTITMNIALIAIRLNNLKLSEIYWNKLFQICHPTDDDLFQYSIFCLKNKDFENFRKYYNYRITKKENPLYIPKDLANKDMWKGEDISGKTLLVFYEQGYGDNLLVYGYMPRLAKLAKKVIFLVQEQMYSLLKDNEFNIEILNYNTTDISKLDIDYYIPSMSILSLLQLDENNISVGEGYINADKNLVEAFKEKYFNNNKFKIGIAHKGHKSLGNIRDIPIKEFLPLCDLENTELYLLTVDVSDEVYEFCQNHNITVLKNDLNNFAQTAAAMENLDIVVSCDNVILNLAGAMGKKTFGLFNWYYEYRWYDLTGEDVGWYTSVRPFVNNAMDDWQSSITKVVEEIEKIK